MTQEVLIPKMRRLDKRHREIKIPFINLVLIFCSILFLIATTFVNLNIKHYIIPIDLFTNKALCSDNFIYSFWIVPQIPAVMMICSVLGKRMAVTTVIHSSRITISSNIWTWRGNNLFIWIWIWVHLGIYSSRCFCREYIASKIFFPKYD